MDWRATRPPHRRAADSHSQQSDGPRHDRRDSHRTLLFPRIRKTYFDEMSFSFWSTSSMLKLAVHTNTRGAYSQERSRKLRRNPLSASGLPPGIQTRDAERHKRFLLTDVREGIAQRVTGEPDHALIRTVQLRDQN